MSWDYDPPVCLRALYWLLALIALYVWLISIGAPLPVPGGGQ